VTRFIVALSLLVVSAMFEPPMRAQDRGPDRADEGQPEGDWDQPGRARRIERIRRIDRMRRLEGKGVHLRVFRSYTLPEEATASEPIVVIGGSARIDGHAEDDVVVIGGSLRLGPKAVVDGDVVTVGGELMRDPGASVGGTIDEAAIPWPSIAFDPDWSGAWWPTLALGGSVIRMCVVLMIAVLLMLVAPGWIATIAGRPAAASGFIGVVTEVLFVPALLILIIALVVSIIGIPLLAAVPFLLAAFGVVWVAGLTGVAVRVGRALRGASWSGTDASVGDFLLGYAAIVAVTVTAHALALTLGWVSPLVWPVRAAGMAIEYVAWTIGLGAGLASLFAAPRLIPPPMPTQSGL